MLAGLQGIPEETVRSRDDRGAGRGHPAVATSRVPLLRPRSFFAPVTVVDRNRLYVRQPFVLTQGGPGDSSTNFGVYLDSTKVSPISASASPPPLRIRWLAGGFVMSLMLVEIGTQLDIDEQVLDYFVLMLLTALFLAAFYWLVVWSLSTQNQIFPHPPHAWPVPPGLDELRDVLTPDAAAASFSRQLFGHRDCAFIASGLVLCSLGGIRVRQVPLASGESVDLRAGVATMMIPGGGGRCSRLRHPRSPSSVTRTGQ